jgi:hypothetical protein
VPESVTVVGECGSLLLMDILPVQPPGPFGEKDARIDALCPAGTVTGAVSPEIENPVPEADREEIVTSAVPLLFSVTVCDVELPTRMLPRLKAAGVAASCP